MCFQIKLTNEEDVIISDLGKFHGGFSWQPLNLGARFSCYFHILYASRSLQNSYVETLGYGKIFAHRKIKSGRKSLVKKKRKATGAGGASPDFEQRSRRQTIICHARCQKRAFLFFMQVPALIPKRYQSPRIVILKVYVDSLSYSSAHFPVFPFLLRVFLSFGNGLLFPGNIDPSSLTLGGLAVPLVCGFRRRDNQIISWRDASCLRSFVNLNLAFESERNTTTLSESIGYIDLTYFCPTSPKHSRNNDKRNCVGKFWYLNPVASTNVTCHAYF